MTDKPKKPDRALELRIAIATADRTRDRAMATALATAKQSKDAMVKQTTSAVAQSAAQRDAQLQDLRTRYQREARTLEEAYELAMREAKGAYRAGTVRIDREKERERDEITAAHSARCAPHELEYRQAEDRIAAELQTSAQAIEDEHQAALGPLRLELEAVEAEQRAAIAKGKPKDETKPAAEVAA